MALTSAQLDEHTNRLYDVVTFLIRILEAHDYTHAQEQLSSELVSACTLSMSLRCACVKFPFHI